MDTDVAVCLDEAGQHPLTGRINNDGVIGNDDVGADRGDQTVLNENSAVWDRIGRDRDDVCVDNGDEVAG